MKDYSSTSGKSTQDYAEKQKKMKQRESVPLTQKNGQELKLETRDDYFNSQLSSRLSSLLLTSTIHLPHVKHAQHFSRTTCCGRFVAYQRSCKSGRPTWSTTEKILTLHSTSLLSLHNKFVHTLTLYSEFSAAYQVNSWPCTVEQ